MIAKIDQSIFRRNTHRIYAKIHNKWGIDENKNDRKSWEDVCLTASINENGIEFKDCVPFKE